MTSTAEQLQALLHKFDKSTIPEIEKAAEAGDAEAQFKLGALYANGKGVKQDSKAAAQWLRKSAKQGMAPAQTLLGWCYAGGNGVSRNPGEAIEWYSKAAEQGDTDAMSSLADLYLEGWPGIERNIKQALNWYEKAANLGHPKAQYQLGKLLSEGKLVQQNDEAAFQWLTLAIMSDSEAARQELAMLTARLDGDTLQRYKDNMLAVMQMPH
ncbi:MAG: tetratricopeptide repeat protein [Pseudomonadota bacterium]